MVGMEFLAQLHVETKWNLRGEFPELIAKLSDIDDVKKFPAGFRYCIDVGSRLMQLYPSVKPGKPRLVYVNWKLQKFAGSGSFRILGSFLTGKYGNTGHSISLAS